MTENDISFEIRGAIFAVYNEMGPGLFESVYEAALEYELQKRELNVQSQKGIVVKYDGQPLDLGFRADLIVENKVIIEIKSVEFLANVHHLQLLTYLRATGLKLGILVNFNTDDIKSNIIRKVNKL